MKIAVTGFFPFKGRSVNPSQLIVERLNCPEGCSKLVKKILNVEYRRSTEELLDFLETENPDVLLSIGQAGNAPGLSVERIAINLDNTRTADGKSMFKDEAGDSPVDEPIRTDGPMAYMASIPVWDIVNEINRQGIAAKASYSAGTFICNHILYEGLYYAERNGGLLSGFIHVPFLPEQLEGDSRLGCYSMELDEMVKGIQIALEVIVKVGGFNEKERVS